MMGTRSGSIDPSIIEYICKETGKTISEVMNDLNKNSGLYGICGAADCRDVKQMKLAGDEKATLAFEMYCTRIAKYIAEYCLELGGKVDSIILTAGVGENGDLVRKLVMKRLTPLGITFDEEANDKIAGFKDVHEGAISGKDSKIKVEIIPTDEEIMIARDTYKFI